MSAELCGYLIKGVRPCVVKVGHKGHHRDAAYRESRRATRDHKKERQRQDLGAKKRKGAAWEVANRDKRRGYSQAWHRNNPEYATVRNSRRRARRWQVPHVDWTRAEVMARYGAACYLCAASLQGVAWEADHVIPLNPGWDCIENIRPACPDCNNRKRRKMPPIILQMRIWYELLGVTAENTTALRN